MEAIASRSERFYSIVLCGFTITCLRSSAHAHPANTRPALSSAPVSRDTARPETRRLAVLEPNWFAMAPWFARNAHPVEAEQTVDPGENALQLLCCTC